MSGYRFVVRKVPKCPSTLFGLALVFRLLCLHKCGRFHEPEHKQRHQQQPLAREVRYSVGRTACTHQQLTRVSAAQTRIVWTHLNRSLFLCISEAVYTIHRTCGYFVFGRSRVQVSVRRPAILRFS
jgi:hypothetical protein